MLLRTEMVVRTADIPWPTEAECRGHGICVWDSVRRGGEGVDVRVWWNARFGEILLSVDGRVVATCITNSDARHILVNDGDDRFWVGIRTSDGANTLLEYWW